MQQISRWQARAVAAVAVLASAVAFLMAVGPVAPASAALLGCAWQEHIGLGGSNTLDPDANASYWVGDFLTLPGSGMLIEGTFPTARYMSYTVYRNGTPISSAHLYDSQIQPLTGVNPFQSGETGTGTYELRVVEGSAPTDPAPNTLYVGPTGLLPSELEILLRVYDPANTAVPAGTATLPDITPTLLGLPLLPLLPCTGIGLLGVRQPAVSASPAATTAEPVWAKSAIPGTYPNPDTGYLLTSLNPGADPLVVVRATVPTFPDTNAGQQSWQAGQQVRYWSLCENAPAAATVVGCVGDFQAVQNAGTATFVISTPANRPANATTADGINWIPFGSGTTGTLIYRQVLASPSFSQSIAQAPAGDLAGTMGSYLPQIAYCSQAEYAAAGASGCLAAASSSAG